MELYFERREQWREWLREHHDTATVVWLVFFKKHTGTPSMSYDAAVEEALCFGWIDSIVKRLDENRFARKFTPRKDTSKWSASNLRRVDGLIRSGRMTEVGLAKVPADVEALPPVSSRPLELPPFFAEALAADPRAQSFFSSLAPSYRRDYIHWVGSAKRAETRERRLHEALCLLAQGRKLGMK